MTSEIVAGRPYQISVHPDRGFFELVWRGPIGLDSIRSAYSEVATHPDWKPHFNRLVVYTEEAEVGDIDFADLDSMKRALSDWQGRHAPGRQLFGANVVESTFFDALGAVWKTLFKEDEALTVRVFKTRDAALDWLEEVRPGAPVA